MYKWNTVEENRTRYDVRDDNSRVLHMECLTKMDLIDRTLLADHAVENRIIT